MRAHHRRFERPWPAFRYRTGLWPICPQKTARRSGWRSPTPYQTERKFAHPKSKLDLYQEMNSGKVILINTALDLLKQTNMELFGRFFIALIAQSAQERAVLPESQRMPTIVYIDEAADYFDKNIEMILVQARKYKVGMVLAHQCLNQLTPNLAKAFSANTWIKFAGGNSVEDARTLSSMLQCETEFIQKQPKFSFAARV